MHFMSQGFSIFTSFEELDACDLLPNEMLIETNSEISETKICPMANQDWYSQLRNDNMSRNLQLAVMLTR